MKRRYIRREIRVGDRVVTGEICPKCFLTKVIFPESLMDQHITAHNEQILRGPEPVTRYRRGRPPGSRNRYQMSSTGVQKKRGIRGT